MSRSQRNQRLVLGVGVDEMTLLTADSGKLLASVEMAAGKDAALPESAVWLSALSALIAKAGVEGDIALHATVSDHWSRYWMQAVPEGIGQLSELRALTAARFADLFGLKPDAWSLSADWQSSGLMLACALPLGLVEALRAPPGEAWKLASLQPASIRMLGRHAGRLPSSGWALCAGSTGITLFQFSGSRICHVRHHPTAVPPSVQLAEFLLEAEMLRRAAPRGEDLHVFGRIRGNAPGVQLAGLKIVLPRRRRKSRPVEVPSGSESFELGMQGVAA